MKGVYQYKELCEVGKSLSTWGLPIFIAHVTTCKICSKKQSKLKTMGKALIDFGMQLLQGVAGAGMGMAMGKQADQRQIKQQRKLQDMQIQGQQEMMDYGYGKQMEMWKNTNYGAQVEQLKAAGLNPGLLYGMGGGGGTTIGGAGANVAGGTAPTGGGEPIHMAGMAMNLGLLRAQKENIEADTANKRADVPVKEAQVPNIEASTASLTQGVKNQKAVEELTKVQTQIAKIEAEVQNATKEEAIQIITAQMANMQQEVHQMEVKTFIDRATREKIVDTIEAQMIGAILNNQKVRAEMGLIGAQTGQTMTQTGAIVMQIQQGWKQLNINQQNADTQEKQYELNKFVNDISEKTKLTVETAKGIVQAILIKGIGKGAGAIPIKGFHNR